MFESFVNPGYLLAGAALVSLPIIIHLINRMRFKRVRWAAMEFLLKSQKKNRRRLIIEQLILLALRCILILLAVLMVSRYLGFDFQLGPPQNTSHVVVLDDSLSMTDQHREEGETKDCFRLAKELVVKEVAKNATQARTAQRLVVIPLSDPDRKIFDERLNEQSVQDLEKALADVECTALRLDLTRGVEAAKDMLDKVPQDQRVLHVVSDFRQRDWAEPDATALNKALDSLGRAGVKINLVDTAHPYRVDGPQKTPLHHDNLSVIDLHPETRVAARDLPVQFTVTLANHGASERKNVRVSVKVNGVQRLEADVNVDVPPAGTKSGTFLVSFDQAGFNQISANIENEDAGLQGDNVRYAVIDVRKQVPVLVIDGDPINGAKPGGDSYHVLTALQSAKGYQLVTRGVNELEQPTLDQYASIYLLNVGNLSDKALKNLENYVADGGSAAFFLGDKVRGDYYNDRLYKKGAGLFPAPLRDRPQPPLSEEEMQPDLFDQQLKIIVRDEKHPLFAEVWAPAYRPTFMFLPIRRYYPVPRREWTPTPGKVEEVATLPNQRSMRDYSGEAQELVDALNQAINDPQFDKYKPGLDRHKRGIRDLSLSDRPLFEMTRALEALLADEGKADDPQQPKLTEFWKLPEAQKLRGRVEKFHDTVQLGDPLVITGVYGKGKTVAFLTTAGQAWNNWAGGSPAMLSFPAVMVELQKFLTSGTADTSRIVGNPLTLVADGSRYEPRLRCFYQPEARDAAGNAGGNPDAKASGPVDKGEVLGTEAAGRVTFTFDQARKPGLYRFELTQRSDAGAKEARTDTRAFVFNVDPAEGELARAAKDDLEKSAPNVAKLRNPGTPWGSELANRQNDFSESPWFYLIFLVILVIEQALAVHLSFHLKGGEMAAPLPAPKPQEAATAA